MLEFATIPGLTKIFNRDDWQKVFLACATLPDYREKKYSSYFITKDAETRAGKLYYRLTYLSRGGKKYDPISHQILVNKVAEGQSAEFCFGPGEKYEFANYIMCAKYEAGRRNLSTDVTFGKSNTYYYQSSPGSFTELVGYSERVVVTLPDESKEYYGRYTGWSTYDNSSGDTKYDRGWKQACNNTRPWYQKNVDGTWTWVQHPSNISNQAQFNSAIALAKDGKFYQKITENASTKNYTYGFTLDDLLASKAYPVYDYEVIGDQKFIEGRAYYKKNVVGLKTNTEDTVFQDSKTYYIDVGNGGIEEMWETTDPSDLTSDYTAYMVDTNIEERANDIKAMIPGMSTLYIGDTSTERDYVFVALTNASVGSAITRSWLQTYSNDYLYYLNTANIFYTIDEDLGSLTLVTYLSTGSKLSTNLFEQHTDKTFRSNRVYYVYDPWTEVKESGYKVLDSSLYSIGASIATYELMNNTIVYQQTGNFYIVKEGFVGQLTHGQEFYERAGSNFPYEGFVAVTTGMGDNQSRGSLYLCRRKTYQLTEDITHGYTGDVLTGTSKNYYEYHEDTGKYVVADPVYRTPSSSSFAEVTEDLVFQDGKKYYSDIGLTDQLVKGTKAEVEAGTADYYVAEGSTPGMSVQSIGYKVYDRSRSFYYRGTGSSLWIFTKIEPATNRKGLTTDTYWDYDTTAATPGLAKEYFYYLGSGYQFESIGTLFSGVTDTIFGYHDLTDAFYGYQKLRFGSQSKITAGDADLISGTTVGAYLAAHDPTAHICCETAGTLDLTPMAASEVLTEDGEHNYHVRNFDHVPSVAVGSSVASVYCKYDASEKKIIPTPLTVTGDQIGTSIGSNVFSRYATCPTYYYMSNKDHATWILKFSEFQLTFDIVPSTGLAIQSKIDDNLGYYRKVGVNYTRDTAITAGTDLDHVYYPTTDTVYQAGKTYYTRSGSTYTEHTGWTAGTPIPAGTTLYEWHQIYEYSGTYLGRPISMQPKTIYRQGYTGTIPEEIPICVKYLGDTAPHEAGKTYADGEEIPRSTQLYVISNNGENILRDEYYEECYGLYYWDQFFLDHGISANPVTDVDCFFTADPTEPWNYGGFYLFLKWKDPTIMIKKDQPTASPDEWDRTDVILHYSGKSYHLLSTRTKDMYYENYLKLDLDCDAGMPKTVDGQKLWTLLERDFPDASNDYLQSSLFTALREGYIELTATSQTGMTSTYYVKPKEVVWWADTEAEKAGTLNIAGMTSSYGLVNLNTTTAIPGVTYYDVTTGKECTDVYPYVSAVNLVTKHKMKYDGSFPIVKVYTNNVREPLVIGSDVVKGADIVLPSSSAGYILATPCIIDGLNKPNYPKVTLVELARDGRAKNILEVGGTIDIPVTGNTEAYVMDFDHVPPARRVEMGYENAGNGVAVAGTTYYTPYRTTTSVTGSSYADYKEATLEIGQALDNKFYVKKNVPHYQFYTMQRNTSTGIATFTAIDYTSANWRNVVENPNIQIYYKDMAYGVDGTYFKYETLMGSVTLRTKNPITYTGKPYGATSAAWESSTVRDWIGTAPGSGVTKFQDSVTDTKFLKCVSSVFNSVLKQELETYTDYDLTTDRTFQDSKTYYTRSGSGTAADPYVYTVATVTPGAYIPDDTYYEQHSKSRMVDITTVSVRDQFWLPSANNVGFTSIPDPSGRDSLTVPVPAEGALLDAFNPNMNSSVQAPQNYYGTNILEYSKVRGAANILKNNLTAVEWWLRTMPDAATPTYATYVMQNGRINVCLCTDLTRYVFPFFTIG